MSKTNGYYRMAEHKRESLDIKLLEALLLVGYEKDEEISIGWFKPAIAEEQIYDLFNDTIEEGDEIFVASMRWYFVPFVLSKSSVQNLLHILFILSPNLWQETLKSLSLHLEDKLSDEYKGIVKDMKKNARLTKLQAQKN